MRIFSLIPALAVLVAAVAGTPIPSDPAGGDCGYEVGCDLAKQLSAKRHFFEHPTRTIHGLTNAALLRRGLPLKNPIMRRGTPVRRTDPSVAPQPHPDPIPVPNPGKLKHRGIIRIKQSDGSVAGYVSFSPTPETQYHNDGNIANALIVNFETDTTGSGTNINLSPENSGVAYSGFVGLIQGRDDADSTLASGSFQYLYFANTHETSPGSAPQSVGNSYTDKTGRDRTSESAVWTYDHASGALSPIWVNPDGSSPALKYFLQSNVLYVGGDSDAFHSRYPAPVIPVTLEFVEL